MAIIKSDKQETQEAEHNPKKQQSWYKRLFWFIAIWGVSVLALGIISYSLRLLLTYKY